jgi:hypothetical protein
MTSYKFAMNLRQVRSRNDAAAPLLPDRIARSIAGAPQAHLVVREEASRMQVLPEIASLHTRKELLTIDGVGPAAVRRLEAWLAITGGACAIPPKASIPSSAISAFTSISRASRFAGWPMVLRVRVRRADRASRARASLSKRSNFKTF